MSHVLEYEKSEGKTQYGDYIEVEGKPEGDQLKEYVLLLTEQMMDTMESVKVDIHGKTIVFVIKEPNAGKVDSRWTIGWKISV
jgi:hypothetical protein